MQSHNCTTMCAKDLIEMMRHISSDKGEQFWNPLRKLNFMRTDAMRHTCENLSDDLELFENILEIVEEIEMI